MTSEKEREAFERWYNAEGAFLAKDWVGQYHTTKPLEYYCYRAWQAALASLPRVSEEELVRIIDRWLMDNGETLAYNMDGATVAVDPTIAAIGIKGALMAKFPHLAKGN